MQKYKEAVEAFDYVLAIDESYLSAYYNKADALMSLGKYDDAIEVYKESFNYEHPDALIYCCIGECYEKNLEYKTAIYYYNKSIEKDESFSDAWLRKGIINSELENYDVAIKYLMKAIKLDPNSLEYKYSLADIYVKINDFAKAVNLYSKIAEADPYDIDIWLDYSDVFAKENNYKKAFDIILKGINFQPDNPALLFRVAAYLLKLKNNKLAYRYLELALILDKNNINQLFDYLPESKSDRNILKMIDSFKD